MGSNAPVRVLELFAGVGGFRVGLAKANQILRRNGQRDLYSVAWSNQWEPGEKAQFASRIYVKHWGPENHLNDDIARIDAADIPDADMLVGGFPCQDYSVARTLNQAAGIIGKKGVLWWEIHRVVEQKRPRVLFLENVDRLLNSPANQRGRDFAIILCTLNALGYAVEWKVINAADYGLPQRRRRTFILAYLNGTKPSTALERDPWSWFIEDGVLARAFRSKFDAQETTLIPSFQIHPDPVVVSEHFNSAGQSTPFKNAGVAIGGGVYTLHGRAEYRRKRRVLRDVLVKGVKIPAEFIIPKKEIVIWRFLKGAKSVPRTKRNGIRYTYDEGSMAFPDPIDKPARTIVTGEGGRSPSRFKHVIRHRRQGFRRLLPVELEKLNGFKPNHTLVQGISDARRAFLMGNALVTDIVTRTAITLAKLDVFGASDESLADHVEDSRSRESLDGATDSQTLPGTRDNRVA